MQFVFPNKIGKPYPTVLFSLILHRNFIKIAFSHSSHDRLFESAKVFKHSQGSSFANMTNVVPSL